ncbi:hypothetical protein IGB42_02533 [Andreprevotia sp. IGB-42]|uniref:YiiD C-terminal domain-containing protein n=1 Tax=Andreprevotia sp. IGB-42 TaxID=2497473 RepID=UPI001356A093|nr:YiiD C-terminal domain-containing protein [Andreprevotia sp. IGB-42]KAF0813133.1 hypothetical protein IGB42_02533 [Andreprevotia sp. IGB-42]
MGAASAFAAHWTSRLTGGFPVLAAMQVVVQGDAERWQLVAPFGPNRNDHGTAFGGSLSTLATIAGWMATNLAAGDGYDVVIQSGNADFITPLTGNLLTQVQTIDAATLQRFAATLARRGKARLAVNVVIHDQRNAPVLRFAGQYVAVALPA